MKRFKGEARFVESDCELRHRERLQRKEKCGESLILFYKRAAIELHGERYWKAMKSRVKGGAGRMAGMNRCDAESEQ